MDSFHTRLLIWYDQHARVLPWRVSPHDGKSGRQANPYHVWLSEVMLQQTTVATVKAYFEKFITLWPTLEALAAADEEDILKAWAGLGYYSRARNLKKCADHVVHTLGGHFPQEQTGLKALAGIGDYTSAAILTIAFNKKAAVVDGNVERVVSRHTTDTTPLPQLKKRCHSFMDKNTPLQRPGDFVQAMMDLGAGICTPKSPQCALCPIQQDCAAYRSNTMLDFPVKPPKKAKPTRKGAVFIIQRHDGAIWLVKRAEKGLLAGMTGLPTTLWTAAQDGATGVDAAPLSAPLTTPWQNHGTISHTFTHFHLTLEVWHCQTQQGLDEGWWSALETLENEALPTVMRKALNQSLKQSHEQSMATR